MKETDYIVIQAPMVTDLKLSGNKLIVFALIHGYCKDGVHEFNGSINYICEWTNLTRNTVIATLKALVDDDLIRKHEYTANNVKLCTYTLGGSAKIAPVVQSSIDLDKDGSVKNALGSAEIALGGSAKIAPNNIVTNIDNNISSEKENIIKKKVRTRRTKEFVPPTVEEVETYIREKGYHFDAQSFIDYYEADDWYYENNKGERKKVSCWKKKCAMWGSNNANNNTSLQTKENKEESSYSLGADYPTSVDDVRKCDIHSYPNPWYEWMYERCPKISKGARNRYSDWDKIDENWNRFIKMCGNEKILSYACLVLERDGYEKYIKNNSFMWMVRNFLEQNNLYNGNGK